MDQKRFCALYQLHYDTLLSFSFTHLKDPQLAEDVVQDTFLIFSERYLICQDTKQCHISYSQRSTHLFSILKKHIQKANQNANQNAISYEEDFFSPDLEFSQPEHHPFYQYNVQNYSKSLHPNKISETISKLSPTETSPFLLYYMQSYDTTQISQKLSISPEAVRKRLQRAREHFEALYETA